MCPAPGPALHLHLPVLRTVWPAIVAAPRQQPSPRTGQAPLRRADEYLEESGRGRSARACSGCRRFRPHSSSAPIPGPTPTPTPTPTPVPAPDPGPKPNPDAHEGPAGKGDGGTAKNDPGKVTPDPRPKPTPVEPTRFLASGTLISVRIDQAISSDDLSVGDTVAATVSSPITVDGNLVVSTGARARLKVTGVEHAAKEGGAQHLHLALVDVTTEQGIVQVSAPAHQFDGPTVHTDQLKRGGVGAAAGAVGGFVVGKLFHHGGAGAAAGAGGGAAIGVVTAKPQPVKVAAETLVQSGTLATKLPTQIAKK